MDELKIKIEQSGLKLKYIAERLDLTYQGFKKKLDGQTMFNINEIKELKNILNLSDREIIDIFFAQKVQK